MTKLVKAITGSTLVHLSILGIIFLWGVPMELEKVETPQSSTKSYVDVRHLNLKKMLGQSGAKKGKKEKPKQGKENTSKSPEDKSDNTEKVNKKVVDKENQKSRHRDRTEKVADSTQTSEQLDKDSEKSTDSKKTNTDDGSTPEKKKVAANGTEGSTTAGSDVGPGGGGVGNGKNGDSNGSGSAGLSEEAKKKLIRGYSQSIYRVVNREKTYPRLARRMEAEGTVTVELMVNRNGKILKVKISNSSGNKVLDQAAKDLFKSLDQLPAPPHKLAWKQKRLQIPLRYSLS